MSTEHRRMGRADKAVLRLAIGLGLAVLVAYGFALKAPYAVCVVAVLILCKPGPPIPLFKGLVFAFVVLALMAAGVLLVPVLQHYAPAGVLLTGALLYAVTLSKMDSCRASRSRPTGWCRRSPPGRWSSARHRSSKS